MVLRSDFELPAFVAGFDALEIVCEAVETSRRIFAILSRQASLCSFFGIIKRTVEQIAKGRASFACQLTPVVQHPMGLWRLRYQAGARDV